MQLFWFPRQQKAFICLSRENAEQIDAENTFLPISSLKSHTQIFFIYGY